MTWTTAGDFKEADADYKLEIHGHKAQRDFWRSTSRYTLFAGGVGSGKTWAGAAKILMMPPSRGIVVAPTYQLLKDAAQSVFFEICDPGLIASHNRSDNITRLKNGVEILWRSADKPERLVGINAGWAWGDEWSFVSEDAHLRLIARLRRAPGMFWATTTPNGLNWLYDRAVVAGDDWSVVHAKTYDNPHLPEDYIQSLKSQYTSEYAEQELEGLFVNFSGGIFKREWFGRISEPALPDGLIWRRFWDLATSAKQQADFTSSLKAAFGRDGTLYLADGEHFKSEWPDTRARIAEISAREKIEVGVESIGFQLAAVQDLWREPALRSVALRPISHYKGDKVQRSLAWAARAEAGKVKLVTGPWVESFLSEVCAFPDGLHDDWVDAASGAVMMSGTPEADTKARLPQPSNMIRKHKVF